MATSAAKENILKKIRQALSTPVPVPFPQSEGMESVFQPATQDPEVEFAENFTKLQGRFSFCLSEKELVQRLGQLFAARKWDKIFCRETLLAVLLGPVAKVIKEGRLSWYFSLILFRASLISYTSWLVYATQICTGA